MIADCTNGLVVVDKNRPNPSRVFVSNVGNIFGVCADRNGFLYLSDNKANNVQVIDPRNWKKVYTLEDFDYPAFMSVNCNNTLAVSDHVNNCVKFFD